jgi:hypothetical protein
MAEKREREEEKPAEKKEEVAGVETATKKPKTDETGHAEEEGRIVEKGLIYFFYRPKVELDEAHDLNEVQRLYMLLSPGAADKDAVRGGQSPKRLIIVGRKKLPATEGKQERRMSYCVVTRVSTDIKDIDGQLGPEKYSTATKGEREVAAARPCGEGVYALVEYPDKRHTHLGYVLELPQEIGEVQEAFNIEKEGTFVLQVKNPNIAPLNRPATSKKAELPEDLMKEFGDKRWTAAKPDFLNHENVELLLIGAAKDVEDELGEEGEELKQFAQKDSRKLSNEKLFKELRMKPEVHPAEPLTTGEWK